MWYTPFSAVAPCLYLVSVAVPADAAGLADPRLAGQEAAISLDGAWRAKSADGESIVGTVPGDVITDLQRAGKIGDPLYELHWKDPANVRLWNQTWTYSRLLPPSLPAQAAGRGDDEMLLIFDGVKMGATIRLNGKVLGKATDQFVKYNFSIASAVRAHVDEATGALLPSELSVSFDIPTNGRFMACTGGWDWGPYSNTYQNKDHTFTFGIWKNVYLLPVPSKSGAITDVVPEVFYNAEHPISSLVDGQHHGFTVRTRVYLWSPHGFKGKLQIEGEWGAIASAQLDGEPAGETMVTLNLTASAKEIKLWWPAGRGHQYLYLPDARPELTRAIEGITCS